MSLRGTYTLDCRSGSIPASASSGGLTIHGMQHCIIFSNADFLSWFNAFYSKLFHQIPLCRRMWGLNQSPYFKRLWRPGIDSEESIPPACVARRAGSTNRVVVPARQHENRFLRSLKGLQIRAQDCWQVCLHIQLRLPTTELYVSPILNFTVY